ncbi:(2Fe-2S)-binding protein [Aureicoccus marinus]|uniref:(2Fe-2S)-binding protein n=1 Tax=Aureicoccus marinus TaxID=754435 RepID=A0A2S7T5Z5_9FLAO|nr:(2Fe-2S)-binding protein [Aureicoccus marinus]PQJ14915.1 (2Fe-2S)-binding protein [Aureicoccus marinus]
MPTYTLEVNGNSFTVECEADTPLLWVLRDHLNLVGTKFGCGIAQCGACTVHLDGVGIRSCQFPISSIDKKVTTIEGLSPKGDHPVQKAWKELDVAQCGYCQSGQIMMAAALLDRNPNPSDLDVKMTMNGNLCRCGTYNRIQEAIGLASEIRRDSSSNNEDLKNT